MKMSPFSKATGPATNLAVRNCNGVVHPLSCRLISLDWWVAIGLSPLDYQELPEHLARDPLACAGFGAAHLSCRMRRAATLAVVISSE